MVSKILYLYTTIMFPLKCQCDEIYNNLGQGLLSMFVTGIILMKSIEKTAVSDTIP